MAPSIPGMPFFWRVTRVVRATGAADARHRRLGFHLRSWATASCHRQRSAADRAVTSSLVAVGGCAAGFTVWAAQSPARAEEDLESLYQLPEPYVWSDASALELWKRFGINVAPGTANLRRELLPQPASGYRALGPGDEERLRDLRGRPVEAGRNPGVRAEPNFLSEDEEAALAAEVRALVGSFGAIMGGARAYAGDEQSHVRLVLLEDGRIVPDPQGILGPMWRITGRVEATGSQRLPPWGYGEALNPARLPKELAAVVDRIQALEGYTLGPLRDVTINLRTSSVCRLDPHIDPLTDGANCFVLTLLSGTVLTFSPVDALRTDSQRASNPAAFGPHSYTDQDIDCLMRRRSLCHFASDARYRWTHAIRPGVAVELQDPVSGLPRARICDWWGTHENLLERKEERISIVFAFADPFRGEPVDTEAAARTGEASWLTWMKRLVA